MELDTRKGEAKADFKKQDILIEVRPFTAPLSTLITYMAYRKS
jgi:hypothetical protein